MKFPHCDCTMKNTETLVPGRARNSSGSGLTFMGSSGSGFIGFANFSNLRVRVSGIEFIGFHGLKLCY